MLITLIFSRFYHSNFIIQYLLFSTFLSYCTMLLYVWAVVSAVAAFLTPGTHVFIVHTVFLYSLTVCVSKINWWWWWCWNGSRLARLWWANAALGSEHKLWQSSELALRASAVSQRTCQIPAGNRFRLPSAQQHHARNCQFQFFFWPHNLFLIRFILTLALMVRCCVRLSVVCL